MYLDQIMTTLWQFELPHLSNYNAIKALILNGRFPHKHPLRIHRNISLTVLGWKQELLIRHAVNADNLPKCKTSGVALH